ncbi:MAG: bifunctional methylenetetrahydrofolate dehydrogenase/methenyltetrahydrofolate cyclohydrolase FolD [Polyangiaceae bacterium]|nr:bifunctional methylenetetrahydrofolate dehydrogenase/methenyltetrahydrofolate cyclohydrolase FolD [Polyangiaceae bacterium]
MTAAILDGKKLAETVREEVRGGVATFTKKYGRAPGLEVILVGEDPASQIYTRNKEKAAKDVGIRGKLHVLPTGTSESTLLAELYRLNADDAVDGILVQLPLPSQIRQSRVLDAIRPDKDVDGFHPTNAGLLTSGRPSLVPCTPRGAMKLLNLAIATLAHTTLEGAHAVVVGRSNIVGKPMAQLLLAANATVTLAHSRTKDLAGTCRQADVLVAAVGKAELVRGNWVKPGAIVIDVGMNRIHVAAASPGETSKTKLVGDVAFDEAKEHAAAITPVPGGVGPMTIACLLENTLIAAQARLAARG